MKSLSILFVLLLASPASSMVYSWTDSAGIAHHTNMEYAIPMRYRAKVKARYPEQGDISIPQQNVQAPQVGKSVPAQPQAPLANHSEPVKTGQASDSPELQKMKEERIAKKARRNRKADDD